MTRVCMSETTMPLKARTQMITFGRAGGRAGVRASDGLVRASVIEQEPPYSDTRKRRLLSQAHDLD
ncbi:hypothetical protein GCM10009551_020970 [Nocardiopsis tropica]